MCRLYGCIDTAQLARVVLNSSPPASKPDFRKNVACPDTDAGLKKSPADTPSQVTAPAALHGPHTNGDTWSYT